MTIDTAAQSLSPPRGVGVSNTLQFAKNASVIKLAPKKATGAASPMERKLMAELEGMVAEDVEPPPPVDAAAHAAIATSSGSVPGALTTSPVVGATSPSGK